MPRRADTDQCRGNAGSNVSEGADHHGARPNLRSSLYSTLFRAHRATVRGEARDDPPIINVNGVDDEDFAVIDEDDAFSNGDVEEEDVPTDASEGEEGPNAGGILDLYLKLFQLRDLGRAHFSREEEVLIELLQLLKDLHCPLKAFEIILMWAAKSNGSVHTFCEGCQPTRSKVMANLYERYNMNGLIPNEKKLYLPYMQRTVSMIYFDAREVFALLLSCPTLNQDTNYYVDDAKDPFVAPQASSDVGDIHTGRCYRKPYGALIKKFGIDMLLPCVIAMDKTHIDMAGRLQMEPITISHGLLNHIMHHLPSAMRILGYINHSTPAHLPSSADVDSKFNSPVQLADDVVRIKNPIHPPANGNLSWTTLLLNKTHMHIQFIVLKESGFLRLQNSGFKRNLQYNNTIHKVVFHPYVPFIIGDTEGHDRLCGHYTARFMEVKQLCRICECPSYLTGSLKSKFFHRLPKKVDSLVQRGLTGKLQSMSQNYLKNGFEGVRFGMHNKRGIFGACPGKMLHLISLGWFKYCLQAFSAQTGPKSQALKDYDVMCAKLGCTLSRQSDRDVPRTNFSRDFPLVPISWDMRWQDAFW